MMNLFKKNKQVYDTSEDVVDNSAETTTIGSLEKITPESYTDVKKICGELKKGNGVLINIKRISKINLLRMIDFISGFLLSVDGGYKKVSQNEYLFSSKKKDLSTYLEFIKSTANSSTEHKLDESKPSIEKTDEFYTSEF